MWREFKAALVMSVRESENAIFLGYRRQERLELVLVRPWEVLPEEAYQRLPMKNWPEQ
jgi:hypothetical protein